MRDKPTDTSGDIIGAIPEGLPGAITRFALLVAWGIFLVDYVRTPNSDTLFNMVAIAALYIISLQVAMVWKRISMDKP